MISKISVILLVMLIIGISYSCRDETSPTEPIDVKAITPPVNLQVEIISPTIGDKFRPGNLCVVLWKSAAEIKLVDIDLYKKTALRQHIAKKIANTGEYYWTIPEEILQSNHYKIKVTNHDNSKEYSLSDVFFIISY